MEEDKKETDESADYSKNYIKIFVEKPFSEGYFIEAFSRLDSLLDSLIFRILESHFEWTKYNLLFRMFNKNALRLSIVARLLSENELIEPKTVDKIDKFKTFRNILVHHTDGEFEVILKESGFYKKKNMCRNCLPCIEEHLKEIGEPCLKDYSIKILRQKLDIGLSAYNDLKLIFEKNEKNKKE
jgi:hypothetical protein